MKNQNIYVVFQIYFVSLLLFWKKMKSSIINGVIIESKNMLIYIVAKEIRQHNINKHA